MGGGGGGYFEPGSSPEELARRTRLIEEKSKDAAFEAEVSEYLSSELAQYNNRDVDGTQAILSALKSDLQKEFEGTIDLLFGGSIAKHTYVDGLSDIDALVLFDRHELKQETAERIKEILAETLQARYGKDQVGVGNLAVTLTHDGKIIQLLPALRSGDQFKIASADGKSWSRIDASGFAAALTKANAMFNGKLVPCIKLVKGMIATLPEQRRLTGYHTESLAIEGFKDYDGPHVTKDMLLHFFEKARDRVLRPIKDSSGQSVHVDDYLGNANSLERRIVADALHRFERRIRNADGACSLESWKDLFE